MSEVEIHIGKVRKIDLNGTPVDTWCKNKCEELGIELRSWHDGYIDALQDETSYLVHKGNVYDVDDKEYEEYNDISEIYPNDDGSYSLPDFTRGEIITYDPHDLSHKIKVGKKLYWISDEYIFKENSITYKIIKLIKRKDYDRYKQLHKECNEV